MSLSKIKPIILGLTLFLFTAGVHADRISMSDVAKIVGDEIPELPLADGSGDTPEIEVMMLDGKKVKLSSLRGKVCVLDIFASWCPHCQEHAPELEKVYSQFKAQGLTILSLASDQKEKIADVKKFIKDYKVTYPVGFLSNEVLAYYADPRNHSVPQVVLFGKNGKMVKRWIGWSEERTTELSTLLKTELANSTASTTAPETKTASAPAPKTVAAKAAPARRKK